jgi:hypothetical protein
MMDDSDAEGSGDGVLLSLLDACIDRVMGAKEDAE